MPCVTCSTGCTADRRAPRLLAVLLVVAAWAPGAFAGGGSRLAVFPPVDRAPGPVPLAEVQASLESALAARGFSVLAHDELEAFFRRHRVRYTGGVSSEIAALLGREAGVDGIVLTSVDDWEGLFPPRVALTSRWVAAMAEAPIAWMDTSAHHGTEHPRAFDIGIVSDLPVLLDRATGALAESLAASAERHGIPGRAPSVPRAFRPTSFTADPGWIAGLAPERPLRVAVLPFVAELPRRELGQLLASQFTEHLVEGGGMDVLEPGVVRDALLQARVIQDGGPSLPQVDALRALLDVDLVVSGRVTEFESRGETPRTPFVGFSSRGIDTRTRQAVWSSFSYATGDGDVGIFGTGRVRSSITLTSELVSGVAQALAREIQDHRPGQRAVEQQRKTEP